MTSIVAGKIEQPMLDCKTHSKDRSCIRLILHQINSWVSGTTDGETEKEMRGLGCSVQCVPHRVGTKGGWNRCLIWFQYSESTLTSLLRLESGVTKRKNSCISSRRPGTDRKMFNLQQRHRAVTEHDQPTLSMRMPTKQTWQSCNIQTESHDYVGAMVFFMGRECSRLTWSQKKPQLA